MTNKRYTMQTVSIRNGISEKIYFKTKSIITCKEKYFIMIKQSICQEDIKIKSSNMFFCSTCPKHSSPLHLANL